VAAWGQDPEHLDRLAWSLLEGADEVRSAVTRISNGLADTWWTGTDARRCRDEWDGVHRLHLRRAADALEQLELHVRAVQRAQREASGRMPGSVPW